MFLPTLLKRDGTFTDNVQTISTLMDVHFPGSTDIDNDELINNLGDFSQPGDNYNDDLHWIPDENWRHSFLCSKPQKCAPHFL